MEVSVIYLGKGSQHHGNLYLGFRIYVFSLLLLCFTPLSSEVLQPQKNWDFRWVFLTL